MVAKSGNKITVVTLGTSKKSNIKQLTYLNLRETLQMYANSLMI